MSKRPATDPTQIYTKIVERYAPFFDRPEARLRFFNHTLAEQDARQKRMHQALRRFAFIENTRFYQWLLQLGLYCLIFEELRKHLPKASESRQRFLQQIRRSPTAWLYFRLYKARHLFYGACLATLLAGLFGLYLLAAWSVRSANTLLTRLYQTQSPAVSSPAPEQSTAYGANVAKFLPDYRPEKVWLVEQKENYERYSNGARILVDFETDNHPRGYQLFRRGGETGESRVGHEPVGIIYHTSEGDLLPFTADNNESIETRSRRLLEFVRKNRSYNYVIDRFGQIYRIVRDDQAANHAGHSVWADAENVYVGLNESFIGVSFETSSEVGSLDEQLTEAQLIAGRLLTAVLRSRYQIDDANCVAHGLVSVNPDNMLIAYHRDWARNFPFEAMGLSDKYNVAPVSISEFGFTSDGTVVWPGVKAAEEEFKRRAEASHTRPEEMRRRLRERYREQLALTRKLRLASPAAEERTQEPDPTPPPASRGGGNTGS